MYSASTPASVDPYDRNGRAPWPTGGDEGAPVQIAGRLLRTP